MPRSHLDPTTAASPRRRGDGSPDASPPARPPARPPVHVPARPWRRFLAVGAVLLVAGGAWQAWSARGPATGEAEWIWAALPESLPAPVSFLLVRDFDLPAELAARLEGAGAEGSAPEDARACEAGARLLVQGDEEYVLHLNGRRLGSNRHRPGAPLDVYALTDQLLSGANRLAVELRSSRGAGGFLAALEVCGETRLVSDRSWRVVRRYLPGLVEGWVPVPALEGEGEAFRADGTGEDGEVGGGGEAEEGEEDDEVGSAGGDEEDGVGPRPSSERPVSWGRPPVGRWDRPEVGAGRPLLAAVGELCPAGPPRHVSLRPGEEGRDAVGQAVFDFGRPVTGYLLVEHPPTAPDAPAQVSLVAYGETPPRLVGDGRAGDGTPAPAPGAALPLVTLPGRATWSDVVPRTFRFAAVAGLAGPLRASVLEVDPAAVDALPGASCSEGADPGLLGLRPHPLRTPAEDAVRRRLADQPGGGDEEGPARREKL